MTNRFTMKPECVLWRRQLISVDLLCFIGRLYITTGSIMKVVRTIAISNPELFTDIDNDSAQDDHTQYEENESADEGEEARDARISQSRLHFECIRTAQLISSIFRLAPAGDAVDDPPDIFKEQVAIDFTYDVASKIRIRTSPTDSHLVAPSANVGTCISQSKYCFAAVLCPKGEGRSQIEKLLEESGLRPGQVKEVAVDHTPTFENVIHNVLGDECAVVGDSWHMQRRLLHGIPMTHPDRGYLIGELSRLFRDIKSRLIQTRIQLQDALGAIVVRYSRPPRKIPTVSGDPSPHLFIMLATDNKTAAEGALAETGDMATWAPAMTMEVQRRWKSLIEGPELDGLLRDPGCFIPNGTNVNENFHGFLKRRMRVTSCSFELWTVSITIAQAIYNATSVLKFRQSRADPMLHLCKKWSSYFVQKPFGVRWRWFIRTNTQVTMHELAIRRPPFKLTADTAWGTRELQELHMHTMDIAREMLAHPEAHSATLADVVQSQFFPLRSATDIAKQIRKMMQSKAMRLFGESRLADDPTLVPTTSQQRRSASAPRLTVKQRILDIAGANGFDCSHDMCKVKDSIATHDVVKITLQTGTGRAKQYSSGIGIVRQLTPFGGLTLEYAIVDGRSQPGGNMFTGDCPPPGFEIVTIRRIQAFPAADH